MSKVVFISPANIVPETEDAFKRHMQSIKAQRGDWEHVVVKVTDEDSPLELTLKAIKEKTQPEDIVAIVNGEDWLVTDNVCEVLDKVYSQGTEIAWSNFIMSDGRQGYGMDFANTVHPRDQWVCCNLMTFRASTLERVDDSLLRNGDGGYVKVAGDCALYWALLERCYKRKFIPLFLYCKNVRNPKQEVAIDPQKVKDTTEYLEKLRQPTRGQVTRRGCLDVGLECSMKCKFCYSGSGKPTGGFVDIEKAKKWIDALKEKGRDTVLITGGEPTEWDGLQAAVDYIHEKEMKAALWTNGQKGFNYGCEEYVVSVHGVGSTHDTTTGKDGAYDILVENLRCVPDSAVLRFTTTINLENKDELVELVEAMEQFGPKLWDFSPVNDYQNWNKASAEDIQIEHKAYADGIKAAIDLLVAKGIGANVQHVPFCALKGYEKHVVGIMQKPFDEYQCVQETLHPQKAVEISEKLRAAKCRMDNKVCEICAMKAICEGPAKQYYDRWGEEQLSAYVNVREFNPYEVLTFRFTYDEVFIH